MNPADLPLDLAEPSAAAADETAAEPAAPRPARRRVPAGVGQVHQRSYRPIDGDADLVDQVIAFLARHRPELADVAREVEGELREQFGGGDHYVRAPDASGGVARVLEAFNGRNVSEVARELGISRATVYRRLRQAGRKRNP